jgi:hypothetical protein
VKCKYIFILILVGSNLKVTTTNIIYLSTQLIEQEEDEKEENRLFSSVPVCGANLSTPVIDKAYYINEIQYRIGEKLYIENAD